jgi:hypothetical protein
MKSIGIANDPTPIFQNPNSSTTTADVIKPIYGLGLSYKLDKNFFVRIDHTIIKDLYEELNTLETYVEPETTITVSTKELEIANRQIKISNGHFAYCSLKRIFNEED